MYFTNCPRCGDPCLEVLKTHCYCACCDYSPDFYESMPVFISKEIFRELIEK